jgi:hypothetical protein
VNYRTVFDASASVGPNWLIMLVCAGLLLTGACLVVYRRQWPQFFFWPRTARGLASPFAFLYLAGAVLFSLTVGISSILHYRQITAALQTGHYDIVEGRIANFVPAPYDGHQDESFCVELKCFQYSDYVVNEGFSRTRSHGGPMHEGLQVRITYLGNVIIRVEMAE